MLVSAVVGAVLVSAAAGGAATPGQPLADALVVAKSDVPRGWGLWQVGQDPILDCLAMSTPPTFTAQARFGMGTPNSSVLSIATVFATRSQAARYYRDALAATPACVRAALAARHPSRIWAPQPLARGHYGVRSGAWRIRFITGSFRHGFDWSLLNTGTAVLVDVFDMGAYDTHWQDISATRGLGGTTLCIERRVLANAAHRAATADPTAWRLSC
jgi:hypothetical protein